MVSGSKPELPISFLGASWASAFYIILAQQTALAGIYILFIAVDMRLDQQRVSASQQRSGQVWLPNAQVQMRALLKVFYLVLLT